MIDSKNFGIILYILMAFFHFLLAINCALEGNTLITVVQLLGAAFWTAMIHIDPQTR